MAQDAVPPGADQDALYLAKARQLAGWGDSAAAKVYFRHVSTTSALRPEALRGLARVLLAEGRADEAVTALREAIAVTDDAASHALLGQALLGLDRPSEALAACQCAHKRDPKNADAMVIAGHALRALKREPDAIKAYEQAVRLEPRHLTGRFYLADALVRSNDLIRASNQVHVVQLMAPRYQPALVLKGELATRIKDHRQAIASYLQAESIRPLGAVTLTRLGEAFRALGDRGQALAAFELAFAREPDHGPALEAAAALCETPADHPVARRYYRALAYIPAYQEVARAGLSRIEAIAAAHPDAQVPQRPGDVVFTVPPLPKSRHTAPLMPPTRRTRDTTPALPTPMVPGAAPPAAAASSPAVAGRSSTTTGVPVPPRAQPGLAAGAAPVPAVPVTTAPAAVSEPVTTPPTPARAVPPPANAPPPRRAMGTRPLTLPPDMPADARRSSFQLGGMRAAEVEPPKSGLKDPEPGAGH